MTLKRAPGAADHQGMPSGARKHSEEHGYTLVELMVAAFVIIVGMAGAFALLSGANRTTVTNNARMGATNLARELLEDARSVDYDQLTPSGLVPALQAKSGTSGSPWKVSRRGIEYAVAANVCTFDDPKDNVAATPPANVCTPQAPVPLAAGPLEPELQPDDFRRVTVTLTWPVGSGARSLTQISLVNNPSGGLGPRITSFPDFTTQLTTGNTANVPTVTTTAGSVRWNSDGTPNGAGDSTGGPLNWATTWQLGPPAAGVSPATPGWATSQYAAATTVLDGTYTITGQAFDDRGIAGDSRASVLPLNRSLPITVTGFEVGRNFNENRVEFRWNQNPELDIVGYEVYDAGPDNVLGNGNDTLMCSTDRVDDTSCLASGSLPSGNPTYVVRALDRLDLKTGTGVQRSQYAQPQTLSSTAPARPSGLLVTPDLSTGNPALSWSHPDTAAVRFFRIYRVTGGGGSCCTVAQRYNLTSTNATSWVDPNPQQGTVRYWVTAVGPGISESQPSGGFDWVTL